MWTKDGTWQKILDKVIVKDDSVGDVEWVISVDSSVVRAHQHAAGARKKGAAPPTSRQSRPGKRCDTDGYGSPAQNGTIRSPTANQRLQLWTTPTFDAQLYKHRNVVERCFNRLKQFRGLATRHAKRVAYYQTELTIAAIVLWLR